MLRLPLTGPPLGLPFTLNRASPQAAGLVGWWPTVEGAGGIIRNRASALYDMTLSGTYTRPAPSAVVGNAVAYNGSSGYAATTTLNLPSFTASAWVNYAAVGGNNCPIGLFGSGSDKGWWLNVTGSGELYLWVSEDGSGQLAISSGAVVLTTGTWYHIAATYNGGPCAIYINGVSVATGGIGTAYHAVTTANALAIGRLGAVSADYSNAAIADVRIYNRALSAAEVWTLYAPQTRWDLYLVTPFAVALPVAPPVALGALRMPLLGVG